jgi:hypothetical protein
MPQKVRGFVVGFALLGRVTTLQKYSYGTQQSRQKFEAGLLN